MAHSPAVGALTAGSRGHRLIKLNDVDPRARLADVLANLPDNPNHRIGELTPWALSRSTRHDSRRHIADLNPSSHQLTRPRAHLGRVHCSKLPEGLDAEAAGLG